MLIKSNLVPVREPKLLSTPIWDEHTSEEHKWELWDGIPFFKDGVERDRLSICLIYSMGLEHLVELLPKQSKNELRRLLLNDSEK